MTPEGTPTAPDRPSRLGLPVLTNSLQQAYQNVLDGTGITLHRSEQYRYLETGEGPSAVLIHGTRDPSPLWTPLITECSGLHLIAPDRPQAMARQDSIAWLGGLLDELDLASTTLVGHSAGGLAALWFALAHPERVKHLVLIGTPTLPGTVVPLPLRVVATPGLGALVIRQRASRKAVLRFAKMMGEGETIAEHPALIDLLIEVGNDHDLAVAGRADARSLISPWALLPTVTFRQFVSDEELRSLEVATTVIWGINDPVCPPSSVEQAVSLIPNATLDRYEAGHVPWFGHAKAMARHLVEIVTGSDDQ